MLTRNQAKHIQSLKLAKFRKLHQQFIAEGVKLADELLGSSFEVLEVYALMGWVERNLDMLQGRKIPFHTINEKELGRISQLVTPNEVVMLMKIPVKDDDIPSGDVILFLDHIQDPGNMGTILRTADWFGIATVVCSPGCADIYNPKVVQSTMGSITRVKVLEREAVKFLEESGENATIYGTMMEGENIYKADLKTPAIIVIGNESQGISEELLPLIQKRVTIPRSSQKTESLNAAIAASIVCSEFRRRSD